MSLYAKTSRVDADVVLTCLATGFHPAELTVTIRRSGRVLTADDGLKSSGLLPNHHETFQRREYVEVLTNEHAVKDWGKKPSAVRGYNTASYSHGFLY